MKNLENAIVWIGGDWSYLHEEIDVVVIPTESAKKELEEDTMDVKDLFDDEDANIEESYTIYEVISFYQRYYPLRQKLDMVEALLNPENN